MQFKPDLSSAVGQTPLIKLRKASELTGCEILGKAEFMNPGQSVKDRAALGIVGASMGFKTVIVIPNTQSQEKKDMIRLAGAQLVEVPAPEIWEQTDGKIDGFICSVGSGGTLAGVAYGLRERSNTVKVGLADPGGSALYEHYANGTLKSEGGSITEGIGQGRITANLEGLAVDMPYTIPDTEALPIVFDLLEDEGLCLGGSSGINIAGAMRMAREMGPGHTIVTILCSDTEGDTPLATFRLLFAFERACLGLPNRGSGANRQLAD